MNLAIILLVSDTPDVPVCMHEPLRLSREVAERPDMALKLKEPALSLFNRPKP